MKIMITGANRGLGYHLTKMGLEKGHQIVAGVRSKEQSIHQLHQLQDQFNDFLYIVEIDVTSELSIIEASNQVSRKLGSTRCRYQ